MNNIFDLRRFGAVMRKDVMEQWRTWLLRVGMLLGALIVAGVLPVIFNRYEYGFSMSRYPDPSWGHIKSSFTIIFFITGMILASLVMERMKSKTGRLNMLVLPASQFEKYLVRWLIVVPVFLCVFTACAYLAELVRCGVLWLIDSSLTNVHVFDFKEVWFDRVNGQLRPGDEFVATSIAYFVLQSFFLLGGVVWPKNSLIKTFAALFVLGMCYIIFIFWMVETFVDYDHYRYIGSMTIDMENWKYGIMAAVVCMINYVIAYFRFKESEIIQRW